VAPLSHAQIQVDSWLSEDDERTLANDVLDGLTKPFKELAPKHFYDARGSELFEQICEQPEYYPTRTELAILRARAAEIVERTGAGELVELGAGASDKARVLLDAMRDAGTLQRYIPLDVSQSVVEAAAQTLVDDYEGLAVHGVVGDFERHLELVPDADGAPRLVALLGGTIGNFPPGTRRNVLTKIASLLGPEDRLVLGTDLVKDPRVIEAAYNDSAGVTAAFNRNLLHVVNSELDADFRPDGFEHVAFYDRRHEWVEMRLRASRACSVLIGDLDLRVEFAAGEELRTEISAKFTPERVQADLEAAGLELDRWLTDEANLFGVSLARPTAGADG
jgi:L-histidine N-alpha-methyltransferase